MATADQAAEQVNQQGTSIALDLGLELVEIHGGFLAERTDVRLELGEERTDVAPENATNVGAVVVAVDWPAITLRPQVSRCAVDQLLEPAGGRSRFRPIAVGEFEIEGLRCGTIGDTEAAQVINLVQAILRSDSSSRLTPHRGHLPRASWKDEIASGL